MHLVDSHAHLDMVPAAELPALLARAREAGVAAILAIGIGDGPHQMHCALELAEAQSSAQPVAQPVAQAALLSPTGHPVLFASAGIHPQEAASATPEALIQLAALLRRPRCIALGEIGLDYYHVENPLPALQQQAFVAQLHLAAEARRPILIHCRGSQLATPAAKDRFASADAWADLFDLLDRHWSSHRIPGVMHCFSGSVAEARRSLDLGFYLSFAGNLNYPAASAIREAAIFAPSDRILVETDAPFLAPIPHRGQPNQPAFVAHTAAALARLRGVSVAELAALTTANFQALFPSTVPSLRPLLEAAAPQPVPL